MALVASTIKALSFTLSCLVLVQKPLFLWNDFKCSCTIHFTQTASRAVHAWFRVHYAHITPKTTKKRILPSRLHFRWTVTAATQKRQCCSQTGCNKNCTPFLLCY
jgi:hypothetical protein